MTRRSVSSAAKPVKKSVRSSNNGTRRRVRKLEQHRSFRLTKRKLVQPKPLPSIRALLVQTWQVVWGNKLVFLGIGLVYAVLSFVFIQGFGSAFSLQDLEGELRSAVNNDEVLGTVALFGYVLGSSGTGVGGGAATYQLFLVVFTSLAVIWAARQVLAGERPTIKLAFYRGMYPLIPFILVAFVISLQFLPLLIGNMIFAAVTQNDLALTSLEVIVWLLLFVLLAMASLYMIISSIFSLYIVTLPDMTPLKALRSARELVLHRRVRIGLRVLALPIVLLVIIALLFIPLLLVTTMFVQPLFLLVSSVCLVIFHVYMYLLYRSLL